MKLSLIAVSAVILAACSAEHERPGPAGTPLDGGGYGSVGVPRDASVDDAADASDAGDADAEGGRDE